MAEVVGCPACGRRLRVPEELLGGTVRCPSCGATFTAGGEQQAAQRAGQEDAGQESERSEHVAPAPSDERASVPQPTRGWEEDDDKGERRWEQSDFIRRDCEPHRGTLVQTLGIISLTCCPLVVCGGMTAAAVGVALGIAAWVIGSRDLARMQAGDMDPEGTSKTRSGRLCGIIGVALNSSCLAGGVAFLVWLLMERP